MAGTGQGTYYDLTDPEVRQNWERELHVEVAKRTALMNPASGCVGDTENHMVQRKKEVFVDGGSQATITLSRQLRNKPVFGNATLRDREESIVTKTFKYQINQIRNAVQVNGRITKQRVTWDIWKRSLTLVGEYWPKVIESAAFLHACGVPYNVSTQNEPFLDGTDLGCTFSNVPREPDANHIVRINDNGGGAYYDEDVNGDPSAILDTDIAARLVAQAKVLPIPIRPAMIHGEPLYVLWLHTYQVRHLKQNFTSWFQKMRDAMKGGMLADNPRITGALGIEDGVLFMESAYIPTGFHHTTHARQANTRRAVFGGAQMLTMGFGKETPDENTFVNAEESWDYANNKGISAAILSGIASPYYAIDEQGTTDDFAKIVVTSYAKEIYTSV